MKLPCGIISDLLPLYCDGACGDESRAAVEEHLETCEACRLTLRQMQIPFAVSDAARARNLEESKKAADFGGFLRSVRGKARRSGLLTGLAVALAVACVAFYLFPLFIVDTGSGMFFLLMVIPAFCFASSLIYGGLAGFRWWFPLAIGLLFVPAIFIYFNSSAAVYCPIFGLCALGGNLLGALIRRAVKGCRQ